jgi:hypothetical protein
MRQALRLLLFILLPLSFPRQHLHLQHLQLTRLVGLLDIHRPPPQLRLP